VGARDIARDAQAEPGAAGRAAARSVASEKRLECLFQFLLRDAGPLIEYADGQPVRSIFHLDRGAAAVADRVVHEIGEAAPQGERPARVWLRDMAFNLDFAAG